MAQKEAKARIKIDQLLRETGWRFFDENSKAANIQLEIGVKIRPEQLEQAGDNFEIKTLIGGLWKKTETAS